MRKIRYTLSLLAILLSSVGVWAQEGSLNAFSPYTFYGVGNLSMSNGTSFDGMAGVSVGFRSYMKTNLVNPAAFSAIGRNSMLFEVGITGSNVYSRQYNDAGQKMKSSDNSFNFSNVSLLLPLTKKLGLGFSAKPYSSVGYKTRRYDTSDDVMADLGSVLYEYVGEGNITQMKLGIGWEPFKNFSIGAEAVFYHGAINRKYSATITSFAGNGEYSNLSATASERINRFSGNFGFQWNIISTEDNMLTLGATYNMGCKLKSQTIDYIPSGNVFGDSVRFESPSSNFRLPQSVSAGLFFHRQTWSVGIDYEWANWGVNGVDVANNVAYRDTHTIRIGALYTPSRFDVRNPLKRLTYKAGFRYGDSYLVKNGFNMTEKAVSIGIEVPFKTMKISNLNLALEYCWRGTLQHNLIQENCVKLSIGVMFFGGDFDYWFVKKKFK